MTQRPDLMWRAAGLSRRLRGETPRSIAQRVVRRASIRLSASELDFPLLEADVVSSDRLPPRAPKRSARRSGLTIGWVCTPPSRGSGGHTTMFRMIQALERAGHACVVLLYDRHGGDSRQQEAVIRECWPCVRAEVRSVDSGFSGLDGCFATGWPTAHVLAARSAPSLPCFYFIQDFEPFFYARGSEYELAADTYRFGFTNIALGHMVQARLLGELGVTSALVPFSCDTSVYRFQHANPRNGLVFYTKADVPRRGYRLAALALTEFHARYPEQEIHVYGDALPAIGVPVTMHERLSPPQLNDLYNRCIVGLAMSFTNISLVAEEMLAAGCIPVVNDSPDSRADLDSPSVAWSPATPGAIADTLCRTVEAWTTDAAVAAAKSVHRDDWAATGEGVVRIVEETVAALSAAPTQR